MPTIVRLHYGNYRLHFWSNEGNPSEPVHIHVTKSKPSGNDTKFWLMSDGTVALAKLTDSINSKDVEKLKKDIKCNFDIIYEAYMWTHSNSSGLKEV